MKSKIQVLILGIIVITLILSGCEGNRFFYSDEQKLAGTWSTDQLTENQTLPTFPNFFLNYSAGYQFSGHKVRNFLGINGTWELKDGKLIIIYNSSTVNGTYVYRYSFLNYDMLELIKVPSDNQIPVVYKHQ
jgi:hypothetical protein